VSESPWPDFSLDRTTEHRPQPQAADAGRLGRFELREELGQGTFGVVYRARDTLLHRDVALKVPKFGPEEAELWERFQREARAVAGLQHPNIVTLFDFGSDGGRHFIALELVDGAPLSRRLAAGRPEPRQAALWARDLALALDHAHRRGVLHRDVKPANVLIDSGNRARLTDFGLARVTAATAAGSWPAGADPAATRHGALLGTPAYMAPEQARGDTHAVGPDSDQYGLGVVLYEMLTGRRPYLGSAQEVMAQTADPHARPPAPRECDPSVSFGLEAITLKALQKAPRDRYLSAGALAADLDRWLSGQPTEAPLRLTGNVVRVCPACQRRTRWPRAACSFCGRGLQGVEPQEAGPGGPRVSRRRRRGPDADRPPVRGRHAGPLSLVRTGLNCHFVRLLLFVLTPPLLLAVVCSGGFSEGFAAGPRPGGRLSWLAAAGLIVLGLVLLAQPALGLVGSTLCLVVPRRTRARPFLMVSLFLDVAGLVGGVGLRLYGTGPRTPELVRTAAVLAPVLSAALGLVSWLFFVAFLYRLALHLGEEDLALEALGVARWGVIWLAAPPLALGAAAFLLAPAPGLVVSGLVLVVWFVGSVMLLFRYLGVIGAVGDAIRDTDR